MPNLLALITPTNLASEEEKFFASSTYNPTFHYIWQDQPQVHTLDNPLKQALWTAIQAQDYRSITISAGKLFEVNITPSQLSTAQKFAMVKGKISRGTSEEFGQLLKQGLDYFNLGDVQIILSDSSGFNARPDYKNNAIVISKHAHFEYFSMEGGVRHDLVHILRYRNGRANNIKRSLRYLPTEEGLASWCQDNTNDDNGLAQHTAEYVASSIGQTGSLRAIYDYLLDLGMSDKLAWKRASRHKFGFVNTASSGDIMKPAMYYANELKVAQLSTDEKLRLLVGKIALSDLPDHPTYAGLWPAEKITEYFKL